MLATSNYEKKGIKRAFKLENITVSLVLIAVLQAQYIHEDLFLNSMQN